MDLLHTPALLAMTPASMPGPIFRAACLSSCEEVEEDIGAITIALPMISQRLRSFTSVNRSPYPSFLRSSTRPSSLNISPVEDAPDDMSPVLAMYTPYCVGTVGKEEEGEGEEEDVAGDDGSVDTLKELLPESIALCARLSCFIVRSSRVVLPTWTCHQRSVKAYDTDGRNVPS